MSYSPNALGFFIPTGCSVLELFPAYHAYESGMSPPANFDVIFDIVPSVFRVDLAAYSHSASVGNLKLRPVIRLSFSI